jgi:acetyl-CoA C-acetyltransferase
MSVDGDRAVTVAGYSELVFEDGSNANLEQMIFQTARSALHDAGIERSDLDAIVLAASDQTDGRAISSMLTAGPAGAYLKDEINIASSPGHAFAVACLSIRARQSRCILVASWGKASELAVEGETDAAERLSSEPYFDRDAGVSALAALGFQAGARRAERRQAADAAHAIVVKSHTNAGASKSAVQPEPLTAEGVRDSDVVAFPLRRLEIAPSCDGVFAVVLAASERRRAEHAGLAPVYVGGVGWAADGYRLSDRDLVLLPHLRSAAARAFADAKIVDPRSFDVWELHDYTADAELLAYEALGLCAAGEADELALAGVTARDGRLPVNPEGGSLRGEAPFGGGLRKVIDAVSQLRGEAGVAQVPGARRALAQIATGFAGQFQTVIVLEGRER